VGRQYHIDEDDDGVDESQSDSFAHQKSKISGNAVSPPYDLASLGR